jgi:hypothetical protein
MHSNFPINISNRPKTDEGGRGRHICGHNLYYAGKFLECRRVNFMFDWPRWWWQKRVLYFMAKHERNNTSNVRLCMQLMYFFCYFFLPQQPVYLYFRNVWKFAQAEVEKHWKIEYFFLLSYLFRCIASIQSIWSGIRRTNIERSLCLLELTKGIFPSIPISRFPTKHFKMKKQFLLRTKSSM